MQQEREEYHEDLKSKGLDVKTWTKRKLLEKRREEKEQRNLRIEIAKSQAQCWNLGQKSFLFNENGPKLINHHFLYFLLPVELES